MSNYQRLPGTGRRSGIIHGLLPCRCRMWEGPDHLLQVRYHLLFDEYRRYYFRSIQEILIERTQQYAIFAVLLGLLAAALLFLLRDAPAALLAGEVQNPTNWILGFLAVLPWLFLILHLAKGPTCRVYIRTPLGRDDIGAWNRLRTVEANLRRLRSRIEEAQKDLPEPGPHAMAFDPGQTRAGVNSDSRPQSPGTFHAAYALLLIFAGVVASALMMIESTLLLGIWVLLLLGGCGLNVVALVKQVHSRVLGSLAATSWVVLVLLLALGMAGLGWQLLVELQEVIGSQAFQLFLIGFRSILLGVVAFLLLLNGFVALLLALRQRRIWQSSRAPVSSESS